MPLNPRLPKTDNDTAVSKTYIYYRGYQGRYWYSHDLALYVGEITEISDTIRFETDNEDFIQNVFEEQVDSYLPALIADLETIRDLQIKISNMSFSKNKFSLAKHVNVIEGEILNNIKVEK